MTKKSSNDKKQGFFTRMSKAISHATGTPYVFFLMLGFVVVWACSGPIFGFSDTWQLVINTSTTIITFLMVFLIQNTQNRDTAALQIKLDELLRVTPKANTVLLDLEELSEEELEKLHNQYEKLAAKARKEGKNTDFAEE